MPDSFPSKAQRSSHAAKRYRRLVRCEVCFRQFDAGGLAPGERFRCACGTALRVPRTAAQEALVVRCASCGAPRTAGAEICAFCTAPFKLGEGARNTLCPVCTSRLGDQQRFCHGCGTSITPESVAGEPTEFACPSCKPPRRLFSRRLSQTPGSPAMLECGGCAGLWLGHRAFDALQERARREVVEESSVRPAVATAGSSKAAPAVAYRPCPVCRKLMVRRNFAAASGIVVDVCGADGLWFDTEELDGILAWIRGGGLERTEERRAEERKEVARRAAMAKKDLQPMPPEESVEGRALDLLSNLIEYIRRATGRPH